MDRYLIIYHHSGEGTDYLEVEGFFKQFSGEKFAEWIESKVHQQCQLEDHEYYEVYIDFVFRIDTNPSKNLHVCTQIEGGRITEEVEGDER